MPFEDAYEKLADGKVCFVSMLGEILMSVSKAVSVLLSATGLLVGVM